MKRYKLQKDLPLLEAGAVFVWDDLSLRFRAGNGKYFYTQEEIENSPEWFIAADLAEETIDGIWKEFNHGVMNTIGGGFQLKKLAEHEYRLRQIEKLQSAPKE